MKEDEYCDYQIIVTLLSMYCQDQIEIYYSDYLQNKIAEITLCVLIMYFNEMMDFKKRAYKTVEKYLIRTLSANVFTRVMTNTIEFMI